MTCDCWEIGAKPHPFTQNPVSLKSVGNGHKTLFHISRGRLEAKPLCFWGKEPSGSQDTGQDPLLLGERQEERPFTSEIGAENCFGPQNPTLVPRKVFYYWRKNRKVPLKTNPNTKQIGAAIGRRAWGLPNTDTGPRQLRTPPASTVSYHQVTKTFCCWGRSRTWRMTPLQKMQAGMAGS